MEKITITTPDNLRLAALWWNNKAEHTVLLLHMMPAAKESWTELSEQLVQSGCNALAIDFRGHGESEGGDFRQFTPQDHQKYYLDAGAAVEFLQKQLNSANISIGGASIGANIAIKIMTKYPGVRRGFILSAGLDYHGVRITDDIQRLSPNQAILLAASRDDGRASGNSAEMAEQLFKLASCQKEKMILETGGHGTDMFKGHPELYEKIVNFLVS